MKPYVLIVAGGRGARMKAPQPKQFLLLAGKPVLMHTLSRFQQALPHCSLILALPKNEQCPWKVLCTTYKFTIPHQIVNGGSTRFHSVQNALAKVNKNSLVAVHDGARPLVSADVIANCLHAAEKHGAAIPVLPVQDSLRKKTDKGSQVSDRSQYVLVQTPQCFQANILLAAYQQDFQTSFTDDATVVETLGQHITLVDGNKENIKITTPEDLMLAEALRQNLNT